MRTFLRVVLITTLMASALAKGLDLQGTGAFFAARLAVSLRAGRLLAAGLVMVESVAVVALLGYPRPSVYRAVLALLIVFLVGSLGATLAGWESCGCFGTVVALPPWVTVGKNVLLTVSGVGLLRSELWIQRALPA